MVRIYTTEYPETAAIIEFRCQDTRWKKYNIEQLFTEEEVNIHR